MKLAETGKIRDIKKIIARVEGLPSCLNGQLVDLGDKVAGIVMGFDEFDVRVLVLGDENKVKIGREVTGVNEPFTIPVGEGFLGRVVGPFGTPCDSGREVKADAHHPVFKISPTITDRAPVSEFMPTGTKILDTFIPLGKGQRQLVIGDRMTGKTVIALDAVINQKGRDVVCVYCCVGKSMAALEKVVGTLQETGALKYTVVMIALDNAPVGEQYLLPYASASMADYFAEKGRDVLVVFDDLTKHAWAYRQLSLLLERPPGREAYPGDIFYIHTQLMERAGKLSEERGGGSVTFLGIAETLEGDLTGYIPSNLISMCDGVIFLSTTILGEGLRPAIDFLLSVSIVGGKSQPPILRSLGTSLRVQYAQYAEVAKLSKLQSSLSAEAERVIKRGEALLAAFQQGQQHPVPLAETVVLMYAVARGRLDSLDAGGRKAFREEINAFAREKNPGLLEEITEETELTPDLERSMDELLDGYFSASGDSNSGSGPGDSDAHAAG